ncbi:MAG: LysM peptidoglycan-binding domain-containing protein [Acidimicrobiia bacterium]
MQAKKLLPVVAVVAAGMAAIFVRMGLASAEQYLVKEGDTLSDIAARYGVPVQTLAEANGINDPNFIVAGHLLVVPSDGGAATEYLVRPGDTLWTISDRVGIPVTALAKANGLEDPDWVPAGRLLSVPPVGSMSAGPANAGATSGGGRYVVREGDDLSGIALRMGVSVRQLVDANDLADANLIVPGQVLVAPKATWQCPVPGASFVNDYGYVKPGGSVHEGVDLFAPKGTEIYSPVGGRVERFPNPAGGKAVMLWGDDGNRYYLAHLSDYGESGRVGAGDVIGYVGNTGDAEQTSPHLHFVIHPGGGDDLVNPFPSLVAACR